MAERDRRWAAVRAVMGRPQWNLDALITVQTDLNGNSQSHARFICEFALENLTKANEVIQSVLRSFNGQLVPNSDSGLLQLFIRQTLAGRREIKAHRIDAVTFSGRRRPVREHVALVRAAADADAGSGP